jgi:hypothetical protein
MPTYRMFPISRSGRVIAPPFEVACNSDEEALKAATAWKHSYDGLEVWLADRRVGAIAQPRLQSVDQT